MKEQFVTYEIALKLKELGFDEISRFGQETSLYTKEGKHTFYANYGFMGSGLSGGYIYAPLWQQVEQWFRDKYNMHITILKGNYSNNEINDQLCYYYSIPGKLGMCYNRYNTYEEAREQAILKAIKLCQKY